MAFDFNGYADAWGRHDGEGVAAYFADGATYADTTLAKLMTGQAEIAAFVDESESGFSSDFAFTLGDTQESADGYVMEWVMSGTHDRSGALPATGKPFAIHGISVGRLEGGRITANRDYWNALALMAEVGLLPPPAG